MTLARTTRTFLTVATLSMAALLAGCSGKAASSNGPETVDAKRVQADKLIAKAQELTAAGQDYDAINVYKEAVTLYPGNAFAWYNLGVLCSRHNRLRESAEAWQVAADLEPVDPRAYTAIGLQYQEQGWLVDAGRYYNRALERDPNYLPALKKSIEVDQLSDNYTDVTLDRIRKALQQETDPKWVEYLRRMQLKTLERVSRAGGSTGR